jgi:small conductance mechanosensitive channel
VNDLVTRGQLVHVVAILVVAFVVYRAIIFATGQLRRLAALETDPIAKARRAQRAETLRSILNNFVRIAMLVVVGVLLLDQFDVNVTPIVAGAGVVGIAIGLGAQSLVRDYLAGAFIIIENQFDIGDQVTIAGHTGTVEQVTLRLTRLRDLDGGVHIVPNGKIDSVVGLSREWARAIVDVTVDYGEDLGRVIDLVEEVCREYAADEAGGAGAVVGPPEVLGVDDLGPAGPRIRAAVKTRPGRQGPVARDLRRRLKSAFDREGIRFARSDDEPAAKAPES